MGIFKLSKKVANSELQQGQAAKKSIEEQPAAKKRSQGDEVCGLAKQDEGFVEELINLRTANETVYRRNDRTRRTIITANATRYRDKDGTFKEINNRLVDNGEEIINEENSFKVKFNKDSKNAKIFDLQKDNNIVSLSVANSAKKRGHVCACKCELCTESENTVLATLDDGTEIQYVNLCDRIKENIIVKERQDCYEYNFILRIGKLLVEEGEHNDLLLKDAETGKTEFKIPAPYMYDANKRYSNKVSYEIEVNGEELEIKVVADADFINSDNCALPVTIDPQIVYTSEDGVLEFRSEYNPGGSSESDYYPNELRIYKAYNWWEQTTACINVNVDKLPKFNGVLEKATLQITAKSGGKGYLKFYYDNPLDAEQIKVEEKTYELDITKQLLEGRNIVYGEIIGYNEVNQGYSSEAEFYTSGEYTPKLIIEYSGTLTDPGESEGGNDYGDAEGKDYDDALETPNIKELAFGDRATAYLNINDGVVSTAFSSFEKLDLAVPLQITNLHRVGTGSGQYGLNWRLNLNRKLSYSANDNYTNTVFLYVDEFGDRYLFNETYYYLKNGVKTYISKNLVEIDGLGNLSYYGNRVYKKQSCNGYVLVPEINDFKGAEYVEQRMQEQIELEEYVQSYKTSLSGYVLFNLQTKEIENAYNELTKDNYNFAIAVAKDSVDKIIITKGEIIQLQSLYNTKEQLTVSIDVAEYDKAAAIKDCATYYVISLKENEILALQNQLASVEEQINYFITQARSNADTLKNAFIKYYQKYDDLQLLKKQMPVNYLKDENGIISGFNEYGDFVCVFDSYGNFVSINYDGDRISGLSDNADNAVYFGYENDLLSSITDNRGRTVRYSYDGEKLQTVSYADGTTLTFKYSSNRVTSVVSSDGIQGKASYADGKFARLQVYNLVPKSESVSDMSITYGELKTAISDETGNSEEYTFYESGRIKSYRVKDNKVKDLFTEYTYEYDGGRQTTSVETDFVSGKKTTNIVKLNDEKSPVSETSDWQNISDGVKIKTAVEYAYDENGLPISKFTRKYTDDNGDISEVLCVEKYNYNANGSLILTESYIDGEEQTQGVNYVKNVYDENGNATKSISWNSLDSSSKFYSESVLAENGRVLADKDEAGEVCAEYEYVDGTNVVNSVKYANGGSFAYGRNPLNDTVTSVTQSTDGGESNTTDITYQNGLPVQVKSGNTVIDYSYDYKGRKTQITVNGVVHSTYRYGKYSYNPEEERADYGYEEQTLRIGGGKTCVAKKTTTGKLDDETSVRKITESLTVDGKALYTKNYDVYGRLTGFSEAAGNYVYSYDKYDKLIKAAYRTADTSLTEDFTYDGRGGLTQKALTGAVTQTYTFAYKNTAARDLDYISFGGHKFKPLTDVNGRNTGKEIYSGANKLAAEYISYRKVGDHATNTPATVWYGNGEKIQDSIKYKYDRCGNIIEITENGHIAAKYEYDKINRLVREDNKQTGKTVLYSYDNNGNIVERCEYDYTARSGEELTELDCTHYSYDYEGDRLVSYNGEEFAYNDIGNPAIYRGKAVEWQYGTRLIKLGETTFAYDGFGRRIKKGDVEYTYDSDGRLIKQSNGLEFVYDHAGVVGAIYGGEQYFYRKDVQGNIIAVLDSTGKIVVRYIYDSWGNHAVVDVNGGDITTGIGVLNPFRYRGYYYDDETGLYFLQTRYYDPEVGRFISQDSIDYADPNTINGLNLYAYCGDNPVMRVDPTGTSFLVALIVGAIIAGIVAGTISTVSTAVQGGSALDCLGSFVGGFITGAVLGAATILGAGFAVGAITATAATVLGTAAFLTVGTFAAGIFANWAETKINGGTFSWDSALRDGAITFAQGLLSFGIGMAMGSAGFYDNLKLGNGYMDAIKYTSEMFKTTVGTGGFKTFWYGTLAYLGENLWPMVIRSFMKSIFTTPWNLIKL